MFDASWSSGESGERSRGAARARACCRLDHPEDDTTPKITPKTSEDQTTMRYKKVIIGCGSAPIRPDTVMTTGRIVHAHDLVSCSR